MPVHAASLIVPITHHQHSGLESSSGQETDYASAHEVAMGRRILTTLASRVEPTKDSSVLTNSPSKGGAPDRSHGGASGKLGVEETGERSGHYLLPAHRFRAQIRASPRTSRRSVDQG